MSSKTIKFINWALSITLCGLGVSLCTKAAFGLSMIAAPPYILHCFLRESFPWYTQGMSEYVWEAVILVITCLAVGRFRIRYLLSLVTAVLSGFIIDFWLSVLGGNGMYESFAVRIIAFICGAAIISLAVAFVFRTNFPPQVYELLVGEISDKYHFDKSKTKLINDLAMLIITIVFARALNHSWEGVGIGTIIVAFLNAPLIDFFGRIIDRIEKKQQRR